MSSLSSHSWELAPIGSDSGVPSIVASLLGSHLDWSFCLDCSWDPLPPWPLVLSFSSGFVISCRGLLPFALHLLHRHVHLTWPLIVSGVICMVDRALVEDLRSFERRLEDLLRDLRHLSIRAEGALTAASETRSEAWDIVTTPRPAGRGSPPSSSHECNSLAREIPAIPDFCVRLCANLSSGTPGGSGRTRAGYWARFCLEGRLRRPRPSWPLELKNQYYVVLRAENYPVPLVCNRSSDYRAILQDFEGDTISHAFPSQSEAKVYCQAAGVAYPETFYQWTSRR